MKELPAISLTGMLYAPIEQSHDHLARSARGSPPLRGAAPCRDRGLVVRAEPGCWLPPLRDPLARSRFTRTAPFGRPGQASEQFACPAVTPASSAVIASRFSRAVARAHCVAALPHSTALFTGRDSRTKAGR